MEKKDILLYIRKKGRLTRSEIAAHFRCGPAAVSRELKHLFRRGLLVEDGYADSAGGRPSALVALNPRYGHGVGVEVSRRGIRSLVMRFDGEVVAEKVFTRTSFAEAGTAEAGMKLIAGAVRDVLPEKTRVLAAGVAISGIVERRTGVSVSFPDFPGWENVPLGAEMEREFGIPVRIESLIHASVRGEYVYGRGRGCRNMVYVHVGKGISCGAVINGEVYYGSSGMGGELGHVTVVPEGPLCYCGKYGCLESVASPMFIEREARKAVAGGVNTLCGSSPEGIEFRAVAEAAGHGDRFAYTLLERAGTFLGRAAAGLANVFAPDVVVVGGDALDENGVFFRLVRDSFRAEVLDSCSSCRILPGMLQERAACVGAGDAALAGGGAFPVPAGSGIA